MEKIVRILEQSALQTKSYTDKKTGEQKVMNAVTYLPRRDNWRKGCELPDV